MICGYAPLMSEYNLVVISILDPFYTSFGIFAKTDCYYIECPLSKSTISAGEVNNMFNVITIQKNCTKSSVG
jgi:hypothetical protein